MDTKLKNRIAVVGLLILGVTMIVIGAMGSIAPPIITGVGFALIAWAWPGGAG